MKNMKSKLDEYLKNNKIRQSKTRDRFFELFQSFPHHVELSELLTQAKKNKIAEASVYRSLKLLLDADLVSKVQGAGGKTFYELSKAHHDHMICLNCGKIIEFQSPQIEKLQNEVAKKAGFKIESHVHELYGYCSDCPKN